MVEKEQLPIFAENTLKHILDRLLGVSLWVDVVRVSA